MTGDRPTEVVASRLRELRKVLGLRQQDLADRTNRTGHPMSRATIAKIESGGRADVKFDEVIALAQALGVPLATLYPPLRHEDAVTARMAKALSDARDVLHRAIAIYTILFDEPPGMG